MKKLGMVFSILLLGLITINVNADDTYYTNQNGVEFTREEYDYYTNMYYEGFQDAVTQDMLDEVNDYGFIGQPISYSIYDEDAQMQMMPPSAGTLGLTHETNAKRLAMAKTCTSSYCSIVVTLTWKGQPNIKSYDVIGALLYGNISLINEPTTFLAYSGGTLSYGDEYYVGGGFGTSVKLQTSSTFMHITQSYIVTGEGTLYASYQHAVQNITKATSQLYTVGFGGYGGVFHFYGNAIGKFDHMGGVDTYINV